MRVEVILLAITMSTSIIVALSAYIWKGQNKRIENLEKKDESFMKMLPDIAAIKTNIEWIKKSMSKK